MKDRISHGDRSEALNAMMKVQSVDLLSVDPKKAHLVEADLESGRGMMTEIEVATYLDTLAVQLITGWNLTEGDGEQEDVLPIDLANYRKLDDEAGQYLHAE